MPAPDIFTILDRLNHAYPEKRLDKPTLKIYIDELGDIPSPLLAEAASQHIRSSPWYPRISELRQRANQLAGSTDFSTLLPKGVDSLALQARQLEIAYFHRGDFVRETWENLARQFERVNRPHRAAELRRKADHIHASEAASRRGEQYPSVAECQRYAAWETKKQDASTVDQQ